MKVETSKKVLSSVELLQNLQNSKSNLIKQKKILDKKDGHQYPIIKQPFVIPSTWTWCYLSDISIIQEGPGIRKHQYETSGIQFLTVTNILEDNIDLEKSKKYISDDQYKVYEHFTINKGDIVTACSGGSWGKSAIYDLDDKLILNTSTLRIRFYDDLGDNKYLYYLTKTSHFRGSLSKHLTGQQPNYGYSHYSKILVPLPPLPEQQRIVAILDEAFAAIDKAKANAEQNLRNAKELFESYLRGVFEKKGKMSVLGFIGVKDKQDLKINKKKILQSSNLENPDSDNEDGWEEKTLAQISNTFGRGKSKHRPRNWDGLYGGKYPFIQTGDIRNCDHYITEYSQTYNDIGLAQSKLWKAGTICITIAANIAETGILTFDACFPDSVIGIEVNEKYADRDFVEYLLQSFKVRIQALGKGSAQANINMGTFENELFPFPSVKQQQTIVQKLDALSTETKKLETLYQQKINDLDELKKSILAKAFSGKLKI